MIINENIHLKHLEECLADNKLPIHVSSNYYTASGDNSSSALQYSHRCNRIKVKKAKQHESRFRAKKNAPKLGDWNKAVVGLT